MKQKVIISVGVTICFLSILLRITDWQTLKLLAGSLNYYYLFIAFLFLLLANIFRSMRFFYLNQGEKGFINWWITAQIYNFMTATLPGGGGEAFTAYILKKFLNVKVLNAVRILIIGRIMDLFSLSLLTLLSALVVKQGLVNYKSTAIILSLSLIVLSFVLTIPATERKAILVVNRIFPDKWDVSLKIKFHLMELSDTLKHYSFKESFTALFYSVLVALGAAISTYLVIKSFGVRLDWQQCFYCFGIYALFQIVPVQGIAGIGTQAAWWALALNTAGYKGENAAEMGFLLHATFYLFIAIIAIIALLTWFVINNRGLNAEKT